MRYHVLASDYDGTLAHHGRVDGPTLHALESLLATGRRLVLVTGRELPELLEIFPQLALFEWVVAENGALLYRPSTKEEVPLADPPSEPFITTLKDRGVAPMSVGRVIVATWEPHHATVLEAIREHALDLQVIFNKGAVMVLPSGINKASGLKAALARMGISPHNVVSVGDAENDHAMLRYSEFSVAVQNALDAVKETADFVTPADHGAGVSQLISLIVKNDLADYANRLTRHDLKLGARDGDEVAISPYGPTLLICGPSASGKSTVATRILESLVEQRYQFCLIDPEGDYETYDGAVVVGGPKGPPVAEEILKLLEKPGTNVTVSMTGMPISDRPPFFLSLLPQLLQMRARTGRPHWLVLDEAHHLMPRDWRPPDGMLPERMLNTVLITVHPDLLAPALGERVTLLMSVGPEAMTSLQDFATAASVKLPAFSPPEIEKGELFLWDVKSSRPPIKVKAHPSKTERLRHRRKYSEGELPPERSFYFRGPEEKLKLRAQNLMQFLELGEGVDDETWEHHRRQGDYSRWFRDCIKDENLSAEAARIEGLTDITPRQSRALIRAAVERDYTTPATPLPVRGAS